VIAMEPPNLTGLSERIGYRFDDPALLLLALTHRSLANEQPGEAPGNYERLEFLGDAVLDFVVSDLLMEGFPDLPEGELTKRRAALVSEPHLARLAGELGLGPLLRMGRGEAASGGREKDSILADALEAVVAAVYLDSRARSGIGEVYRVVQALFAPAILATAGGAPRLDFKTDLQEWVQRHFKDRITYRITRAEGPEHEKCFESAALFRGREVGRGQGRSKKQAEQAAAQQALHHLREQRAGGKA